MTRFTPILAGALLALANLSAQGADAMTNIYAIPLTTLEGKPATLNDYAGKVLLIVNTASRCGYTPQYQGLEALHKSYASKGLAVLGFPANNFKGQEPGTNEEIREFCTVRYGVTFPLFAKISVAGDDIHPLYRFLTDKATNPAFGGPITWNFNKFMIGRDGRILGRFDSKIKPDDPALIKALEAAL